MHKARRTARATAAHVAQRTGEKPWKRRCSRSFPRPVRPLLNNLVRCHKSFALVAPDRDATDARRKDRRGDDGALVAQARHADDIHDAEGGGHQGERLARAFRREPSAALAAGPAELHRSDVPGRGGGALRQEREPLRAILRGKLPAPLVPAEEGAHLEIWLRVMGKRAICGVRLSDQRMRHRTYKLEHFPASLRPTMAAAMVRGHERTHSLLRVRPRSA